MEELFNLGLNEKDIYNILEICPTIKELSIEEIKEKLDILDYLECNNRIKKNIIESNPNYLDRINIDILKLIKKLRNFGFSDINLLLDANPYILNLDDFEIENYINKKIKEGENLEDIVSNLSSNPYLFNEI